MHSLSIPTCYFPSTALFLDDNRDFLLNFVLQLDEGVAYRIFDEPHQALDYIQNKNGKLNVFNQNYSTGRQSLADVQREIYNPNRFAETSVVVVDYAMPGMNGLEFCRRIENKNIKKILLTGQADEKLAIEAFNEGLINLYIKKSDVNAAEIITKSIYDLQKQYFQSMSDAILRVLPETTPLCLQDKSFVSFFKQLCVDNHIIEYYLADSSGSFLLLDEDANTSFLIVKSQSELSSYGELAKKHGADKAIIDQLAAGKLIPGLWQAKFDGLLWSDCANHLVPAASITGNENYHYAYMKGNSLFDVRQQKILSYHRYLEELDAAELLTG